jgi:hypothetical protein
VGLPCFSTELSVILSLTICALTEVFSVIRCSRFIPLHPLYRLRLSLADSPSHADLIEFTSTPLAGKPVLRTDRSRRIAPHPVLPRRSYALIPHDSSPQGSGLSPLCSVSLQVALAPASLRAGHEALRQAQGRLLRQAQGRLLRQAQGRLRASPAPGKADRGSWTRSRCGWLDPIEKDWRGLRFGRAAAQRAALRRRRVKYKGYASTARITSLPGLVTLVRRWFTPETG